MGNVADTVNAIVAPLRRKVDLMVTRAVIKSIKYDTGLQFGQVDLLADETKDAVEHLQEYGFSSSPPADANGVVLFVAGERMHGVIIATDDFRYKPELETGETIIYTQFGDSIKITKDNEIEVLAATKVTVTAPEVEFTGNVTIQGHLQVNDDIDATGDVIAQGDIDDADRTLAQMVSGYNSHVHGGVRSGGATSGGPSPTVP